MTSRGQKCNTEDKIGGEIFSISKPGYPLSCISGRADERFLTQIAFTWLEPGDKIKI